MVGEVKYIENEDGSADISVEMTEDEKDIFASLGIKYSILMACFDLTEDQIFQILKKYKEGVV